MRFSDEAIGTGGGRRGSNERGGAAQQQQQEREELEREVGWLRRELQEQREACVVAEAQGDELQATVEEASCIRYTSLFSVYLPCVGACPHADDAQPRLFTCLVDCGDMILS